MYRVVALLVGSLAIAAGIVTSFALRFMPPADTGYWLLPLLLVLPGCWLIGRCWGRMVAAVTFLAVSAGAYLLTAHFLPGRILWQAAGSDSVHPPPATDSSPVSGAPLEAVVLDVPDIFRQGPFRQERVLNVPPGFAVSVFAAGFKAPRFMAVGPGGDLYLSDPPTGKIFVVPDRDGNGIADRVVPFATGLGRPHGLAFHGQDLYVAAIGQLFRLRDSDGDLNSDKVETISTDVPGAGGHWTRSVVVGPDSKLYLSAGSSCNACIEDDPERAAILRFDGSGGEAEIYATGLRNSVGLAFHPRTGELWASENGRDWLGDDLPPEEINRIREGGDYGWPFCYGRRVPDPEFGSSERCRETISPEVLMQAHSAPLGIGFGFAADFPERYRDMLYVAFHGSWNRSVPTGYKLVGIPFHGGRPAGPAVDLVTGWLQGATVWGRPVDPVVGADGALYLTDDRAGAIYRITASTGK